MNRQNNLQIMRTTDSINWSTWLRNGDQYMKAATPKGKKSRFGAAIRYNLLSLSLESYSMAILDYHKTLPDNHTYTDLMDALDGVITVETGLKERILQYENIQSICAIDRYFRKEPTEEDLDDLQDAIADIGSMAHEVCIPG